MYLAFAGLGLIVTWLSQSGCKVETPLVAMTPTPTPDETEVTLTPRVTPTPRMTPFVTPTPVPEEGSRICVDLSKAGEALVDLYGWNQIDCDDGDWTCQNELGQHLIDQACVSSGGKPYTLYLTTESSQDLMNTNWVLPFSCKLILNSCESDKLSQITLLDNEAMSAESAAALFSLSGSSLTLSNIQISNFRDYDPVKGGLIYATNYSSIILHNVTMAGGRAQAGGAVYIKDGDLESAGGTYTDNATLCDDTDPDTKVGGSVLHAVNSDVVFSDHYVDAEGVSHDVGETIFSNNQFFLASSCSLFGQDETSVISVIDGNLSVSNAIFQDNGNLMSEPRELMMHSGAIYVDNTMSQSSRIVSIRESQFNRNSALFGACEVTGHLTSGDADRLTVDLSGNTFEDNTGLAAIARFEFGNMTLTGNRFEGNWVNLDVVDYSWQSVPYYSPVYSILYASGAETMEFTDNTFLNNVVFNRPPSEGYEDEPFLLSTVFVQDAAQVIDTRSAYTQEAIVYPDEGSTGIPFYTADAVSNMTVWNPLMRLGEAQSGMMFQSVKGMVYHPTIFASHANAGLPFTSNNQFQVFVQNGVVSYQTPINQDTLDGWVFAGMPLYCSDLYPLDPVPQLLYGNISVDPLLDASGRPDASSPVKGEACPTDGWDESDYPRPDMGAYGGPYAFDTAPF